MNEARDPLEAELATLRPLDASTRLRQRIADHRARGALSAWPAPSRAWRAVAVAAVVLLALNLILMLQNAQIGLASAGSNPADVDAIAGRVRRRDPELSATEARRLALLVAAGEHARPRPDPTTWLPPFLLQKEK
jgi:hypothetical protein